MSFICGFCWADTEAGEWHDYNIPHENEEAQ